MSKPLRILIAIGVFVGVFAVAFLLMWGNIAIAFTVVPFEENEQDVLTGGSANVFGRVMIVLGLVIVEAFGAVFAYGAYVALPEKELRGPKKPASF